MATFKKITNDYYAIERFSKPQMLILPVEVLGQLSTVLQQAMKDGLDRLKNSNLPDSQSTIMEKYIVRVSAASDSSPVRIDIREWYSDKEGDLKPMKKGVNLCLEELGMVITLIKETVDENNDQTKIEATIAALHSEASGSESSVVSPPKRAMKRKANESAKATPAKKTAKKAPARKTPIKKKVDSEPEEVSSSEHEDSEEE